MVLEASCLKWRVFRVACLSENPGELSGECTPPCSGCLLSCCMSHCSVCLFPVSTPSAPCFLPGFRDHLDNLGWLGDFVPQFKIFLFLLSFWARVSLWVRLASGSTYFCNGGIKGVCSHAPLFHHQWSPFVVKWINIHLFQRLDQGHLFLMGLCLGFLYKKRLSNIFKVKKGTLIYLQHFEFRNLVNTEHFVFK